MALIIWQLSRLAAFLQIWWISDRESSQPFLLSAAHYFKPALSSIRFPATCYVVLWCDDRNQILHLYLGNHPFLLEGAPAAKNTIWKCTFNRIRVGSWLLYSGYHFVHWGIITLNMIHITAKTLGFLCLNWKQHNSKWFWRLFISSVFISLFTM